MTGFGLHAGARKRFKAEVIGLRKNFPRIIVKYTATEDDVTNAIALPEMKTAYLMMTDVEAKDCGEFNPQLRWLNQMNERSLRLQVAERERGIDVPEYIEYQADMSMCIDVPGISRSHSHLHASTCPHPCLWMPAERCCVACTQISPAPTAHGALRSICGSATDSSSKRGCANDDQTLDLATPLSPARIKS